MNIFRKKVSIEYEDFLKKEDAMNMVKQIPENFPKYFFSIPKTNFNPEKSKFIPYQKTIKTCPGFVNLYKRSLLVTLPFDLYVEFDENKILDQKAGQTDLNVAGIHSDKQLLFYVNNKEYKFLLKITLPFIINSNVSLLISPSCYHFNDFNVLSGIINSKYKRDMNFFIPIKKNQNELYLKQGEALFLMTPLCENKIKLNFKQKNNMYPNLTFSTLKQNILKNLT
tara:strand:- start:66 stop:740 length:675 start_codon:yes stop_codon:yes gene_type:complete